MTPDELVEIHLLGLPLVLRERSRQQGADLLREMTLLRAGLDQDSDRARVPERLQQLAAELETAYGPYITAADRDIDAALDRGDTVLDVTYRLPAGSLPFLHQVRALLAEVDEYCRTDQLLTLAPPPDIAAYRAWSIEQVLDQLGGQPPTAWHAYAASHGLG